MYLMDLTRAMPTKPEILLHPGHLIKLIFGYDVFIAVHSGRYCMLLLILSYISVSEERLPGILESMVDSCKCQTGIYKGGEKQNVLVSSDI